ncbi:MAG: hypothetical protein RBS56_00145 [Candidatus Gracilibacteria bacterium]|nr:hypothetical protein [Candidatus Gracilibacteria bacterium]
MQVHILSEILRKSIHLAGLFLVFAYTIILLMFSKGWADLFLTAVLLFILEIEQLRLVHKPKILKVFSILFRKHEEDSISGAAFFVIACLICFAVFNYWVAVLAMFMTVFGDMFAAIMGRSFGTTKIYKEKTIIGTLSGFTANVIVGMLIFHIHPFLVLIMAFTATFSEAVTAKLDDNLTVPLFAGFLGQLYINYFDIVLPPLKIAIPGLL